MEEQHFILGIDEVGRGPWAGPLVMGGCILPVHNRATTDTAWIDQLTDSKKLSPLRRESLAKVIRENSLAYATGWVHAEELNEIGLAAGLKLACRRVVEKIRKQHVPFQEIVIDGPQNFLAGTSMQRFVTNLNQADLLVKEVSAASIIAKVEHDHYMVEVAVEYPNYGFERHVGYGTAKHAAALEKYGPTPEHRTFVRPVAKFLEADPDGVSTTPSKNTTEIGQRGEQAIADYLTARGHRIIQRNFKTRYYEIDVVSEHKGKVYFTEVKYRRTALRGSGLEAITPAKLRRMAFAAELFMKDAAKTGQLAPDTDFCLAAAAVSGPNFHVDAWLEI